MHRKSWWPVLVAHSEDQWGLITAAQARLAGAARPQLQRLVERGVLDRVQHGVYRLSGSPVDRWTEMRIAWLAIAPEQNATARLGSDDPQGVLSHRSAAVLLNLGDLDADFIEFTTNSRRRSRNADVRIHRGHLDRVEWTVYEGLPVTTPEKTVQMLAMVGLDLGHLAGVVRDSVLRHDIPIGNLARSLDNVARRYGFANGDEFVYSLLREVGVPASTVELAAIAAAGDLPRAAVESQKIRQIVRPLLEGEGKRKAPPVHDADASAAIECLPDLMSLEVQDAATTGLVRQPELLSVTGSAVRNSAGQGLAT